MGCIYFSIPVVGGWHVMQWAIGKSHDSIGPKGEKLRIKEVEGIDRNWIIRFCSEFTQVIRLLHLRP